MDTLIGLKGKDFIILACDSQNVSSIVKLKNDDNTKFYDLEGQKCLLLAGETGDRIQFGEYVKANVQLYQYQNSANMSVKSFAYFTRKQLAHYLRRNPYFVNCLLAGYDEKSGFQLYWCDYLSCMDAINKGAHGYGAYLVNAILDKYYHENITVEEALGIFKKCFEELKNRFVLTQIHYEIRVITKDKMEPKYVTL